MLTFGVFIIISLLLALYLIVCSLAIYVVVNHLKPKKPQEETTEVWTDESGAWPTKKNKGKRRPSNLKVIK